MDRKEVHIMGATSDQKAKMQWILFYAFVCLFLITAITTLLALLGIVTIHENYLSWLFKVFLVEVGVAVGALFRDLFGLKGSKGIAKKINVWCIPDDNDIKKFLHRKVLFIPTLADNKNSDTIPSEIMGEDPHCSIFLPEGTEVVKVIIDMGKDFYVGSFFVNDRRVDMIAAQEE
jgi:hypothetical protein